MCKFVRRYLKILGIHYSNTKQFKNDENLKNHITNIENILLLRSENVTLARSREKLKVFNLSCFLE